MLKLAQTENKIIVKRGSLSRKKGVYQFFSFEKRLFVSMPL